MSNAVEMVRIVALKALPYNKIRMPTEVFEAQKGYADMFVRQGLARLATPDDVIPGTQPVTMTRQIVTGRKVKASKKAAKKKD